jgi:hypothetical protein
MQRKIVIQQRKSSYVIAKKQITEGSASVGGVRTLPEELLISSPEILQQQQQPGGLHNLFLKDMLTFH